MICQCIDMDGMGRSFKKLMQTRTRLDSMYTNTQKRTTMVQTRRMKMDSESKNGINILAQAAASLDEMTVSDTPTLSDLLSFLDDKVSFWQGGTRPIPAEIGLGYWMVYSLRDEHRDRLFEEFISRTDNLYRDMPEGPHLDTIMKAWGAIFKPLEGPTNASVSPVSHRCAPVDTIDSDGNTQSLSNSLLEEKVVNSDSELQVVEEQLSLVEHTYSTDVNSLKKQITALENIRTHMIEALDARDIKYQALVDQGVLDDANHKEWVDYATNLQKDNDRLQRMMKLSAIELNELERENDELQDRLKSSEATVTVAEVLKKSGTFDLEETEPPVTRAQLTNIYNEMNRKESVIQQKDTKATRLIGIIRDKNDEIAQLKNKMWHQKREGWAMSGELYKLRQNQVELNNTHHNWRNYLETLDTYIYGTLLPVWAKSRPYVVYPQNIVPCTVPSSTVGGAVVDGVKEEFGAGIPSPPEHETVGKPTTKS